MLEIREGDAVTIKQIELAIIDRAWDEGWIVPAPTAARDRAVGRRGRLGTGGDGRRAAAAPRRPRVTLFERDEAAGGLVRFGVPDFKIEKRIVQRRVEQLVAEGVELALRRRRRRRRQRRGAARRVRRGRARHRLARAARPAGPRPRARRGALRDGLPVPAQPLGRARVRPRTGRRPARPRARRSARRARTSS